MDAAQPKLTPLLNAATFVALGASGLFLWGAFQGGEDIAPFYLGAFCSFLTVAILLFVITKISHALRKSRERFALALAISNDGMWDWDVPAGTMYFSPRWLETLGYAADDVEPSAEFWKQLIHPDDRERVLDELDAHLEGHTHIHLCENRLLTRDGNYRWNLTRARVVARDRSGKALRVVGVDVDMTKFHQLSAQLSHQESHDSLTGLVNRREFERRLAELLEGPRQSGADHAVCHIDLDQFKIINETCGPAAGDELLCQLTRLMRKRIRHRDTLARIGGDEFGLLMEGCSLGNAQRVARNLLECIDRYRFNWGGRRYAISASIGLVPVSKTGDNPARVLSAADAACHSAKERGRRRVHVYSENDRELAARRGQMRWVSRISRALDESRFRLSFQPISPVQPGVSEGAHYELLIRMQDEAGDIVPPGVFLHAAELYSLSAKLDRWVIVTALDWLARNPTHVAGLHLCGINLSGHSLGNEDFLDFVVDQLKHCHVPPGKICFEITETAAIANMECAGRFIRTLKSLGSLFALDDFGSGLSSFAYLKNLPVDFLKIDGTFIKDIVDDPIHLAMVRSINEIGHVMGMKTVAEFVEDEATIDCLREIGVDYAQGYAICPPRPLEVFERVQRITGGPPASSRVSAA